jgi:FkbM family methyltransferase
MKIYYGFNDDNLKDVTEVAFKNCVKDTILTIPSGDFERTKCFEGDPYNGILKHVVIVSELKNYYFNVSKKIIIDLSSTIDSQLESLTDKSWWNSISNIQDPREKLLNIHDNLHLEYGTFRDEFPEQLMVTTYLPETAKVLEIGGNIGRNTLIIGTIINDFKNMVVLESDPGIAKTLQHNLNMNNYNICVEASALSEKRLIQEGWNTRPLNENENIPNGWKEINTITYYSLKKKYNIEFDTLVADCEGALFYILKDTPTILDNINLIIMENDYTVIGNKYFVDNVLRYKGFKRVYVEKLEERFARGHPCECCKEFFFEVWKKE